MLLLWCAVGTVLAGQAAVSAIQLDINDPTSVKNAAATAAYDMMVYYHGNETGQIPGKLPDTWWEGGAMFMTLMWYWHFTGDDSYVPVTQQGMYWQAGENHDYMPSNYSRYLGNDDQMFWGLAAMTGAELNFPEQDGQPSWLALAQAVFNTQVERWDAADCNGGMRWQIYPYQAGYGLKNAISNGGLFQLAARLARYTNNQTYAEWAEKIWDWSATTPLLRTDVWTIADSTSIAAQCKDHGDLQWTYNYGTYLSGAAYMYNLTNGGDKWKKGIDGLLRTTFREFFPQQYGGNIMSETACEPNNMCDRNQRLFKGFLAGWFAFMTTLAPYTADEILPKLRDSAVAAAKTCTGGRGTYCGWHWYQTGWDGHAGLEEQASATSIFAVNMLPFLQPHQTAPLTADTGGKSKSDPDAGLEQNPAVQGPGLDLHIGTADRAGAGILTVVFVTGWLAMVTWMVRS